MATVSEKTGKSVDKRLAEKDMPAPDKQTTALLVLSDIADKINLCRNEAELESLLRAELAKSPESVRKELESLAQRARRNLKALS